MENEEILRRTEESIKELFEIIVKNPKAYEYEADFHFDLYFLLNHNNFDEFWKSKSVQCEYDDFDIVIFDPDRKDSKEIVVLGAA